MVKITIQQGLFGENKMNLEDVKKLSNKELDAKIAKLCGWKQRARPQDGIIEYAPPNGHKDHGYWVRGNDCPPHYSTDLNVMHDVEAKFLTHKQCTIYGDWLKMLNGFEGNQSVSIWHSSAHCKSVAFILTMEENM